MTEQNGFIHGTSALCPSCDTVVDAGIVERGGDVYMELTCPEHGARSTLYYRDAALYRQLMGIRNDLTCCDAYHCAKGLPCDARREKTLIFMVNVTNNCNMTCDACFSGSHVGLKEPYVPAEKLLEPLPQRSGDDPRHVVFIGGEPTLHPELPQMVAEVTRRGYVPRLASNGLRLRDRKYTRTLAEAGLKWVFLHFDSLDEDRNRHFRGRTMVKECLDSIESCREAGMKVQFGTTVSQENIDELRALLTAAHRAGVFWVSLYPVAEIERMGEGGATFLADTIRAIEEQTAGQVRREDFVNASRVWSRLSKLTGRLNYRQKPTMVSLPLVIDGDRLVPFTRLMNPLKAATNLAALLRFIRSLPSLADYERREPTGHTMVLNIQQFQGRSAFDLEEATHSLMSFVDGPSLYPFDIFNHVHRYPREQLVPLSFAQ